MSMRLIGSAVYGDSSRLAASAQAPQPSSTSSSSQTGATGRRTDPETWIDARRSRSTKIREALEQPTPALSLRTIDERPIFRIQIQERQRIEELLATLNFKTSPAPARRRLHGCEQQRHHVSRRRQPAAPAVRGVQPAGAADDPRREPRRQVSRGQGDVAAISNAERAHAEATAREDVRAAIAQYCSAQPNAGAGIQICDAIIEVVATRLALALADRAGATAAPRAQDAGVGRVGRPHPQRRWRGRPRR